ncbi:hypothetical protein [Rothia dentocariosa]|uniref:hypothetical protein n=1 Tax=Rothia dentocariosa TaxID=2047 RepID=UPI0028E343F1|nr:hypothetical protein [Rothia dentocariosa]
MSEEREDVETTLEQGTTPDASQQKGKWRAIDRIAGSTLVVEVLLSIIWAIVWAFCRFEHQLQVYLALVLIILAGGYLALIFCPIFKKDDDPRWFHARILSSGIVGGSYAFLLPAVMGLEEGSVTSGGAAALRQAILLATGGLIALIALGETRRKNDNDREAAESLQKHQQDTLNQQKKQFEKQLEKQQEQFEANAFKERKAERRERYTKAVEQLGDEKAPIRIGGVYTLVGLVDEWLEEDKLSEDERIKEGQVIINSLCAYIRSPFTLAARYDELSEDNPSSNGIYKDNQQKFYADKAEFKAEADVRLGIIKEIHDRLQGSKENTPNTWSDFEYDFSGSTFFYPIDLTNSYYAKPINFRGSTYKGRADFGDSTYKGRADFGDSTYKGRADFGDSTYKGGVYFRNSTYQSKAIFNGSTYKGWAYFGDSTYKGWAYFGGSTYKGWAYFGGSTYQSKGIFNGSTYKGRADFSGSIFYSDVSFGENNDNGSSSCFTKYTPTFYQKNYYQKALFGSTNNNFMVNNDKGYPIYLNPEGIPLNCKFLTLGQKEYLEGKLQEIEKINDKLFEVKDPEEKVELSKKLWSLNEDLHEWREEATTLKVTDEVAEDIDS